MYNSTLKPLYKYIGGKYSNDVQVSQIIQKTRNYFQGRNLGRVILLFPRFQDSLFYKGEKSSNVRKQGGNSWAGTPAYQSLVSYHLFPKFFHYIQDFLTMWCEMEWKSFLFPITSNGAKTAQL